MPSELFLLDTNATSDLIKHRSDKARGAFDRAKVESRIAVSVLTEAELLFGFNQRPEAVRLRQAFDYLCDYVEILPWTHSAARSYAVLRAALKERKRTVETIDLLIASQAHALGAVLVTRDKDFRHLAGLLDVVNWATDLQ